MTVKPWPLDHADDDVPAPRRLFMVLSPRSLSYARLALASLFGNAEEPFDLALITDSENDKQILLEEVGTLEVGQISKQSFAIFSEADLETRESEMFARYPNIRSFRHGHPCWRKVTDPMLLSSDGEEMIVLDPDIYFPNRFCFEDTLASGLLLMWQKPSCLLPAEVVDNAMRAGIALAHHTDIGVAQWRMPVDLAWLDWLLGKLGSPNLPRSMHVESIVWAALAMRMGGGYLDPTAWLCWNRTQFKRVARKLGANGAAILRREPWADIKCFHAGGEAKWWLAEAKDRGFLDRREVKSQKLDPRPFEALKPAVFAGIERRRLWLRRLGYYSLFAQQ
ncbi:hypothetical protein [Bradyrhizobium erythrophlei]|jgi:hypothetical protein|uniref:Uncharacterized protein n=1 Tax=Bradyrhizobium erythrophlei TaxID=1437360 RepID=A0A1M5TFT7_9BRAD|nr:hypothetical protein [Bradyrhizobium erythrophlei]SHH49559.1 hypothetical protein SAMN05443248_5000 [Bradyrhizobium erythrophlei]